jgi:hypothetical protein
MRNVCKWNNFIYFENMKKINRKFLKIKKWFSEKKIILTLINLDQSCQKIIIFDCPLRYRHSVLVCQRAKWRWIHILCCAASCSAARGPLDFLVIRVSTDLEVIQRSTLCAARYCAAEEQDSMKMECRCVVILEREVPPFRGINNVSIYRLFKYTHKILHNFWNETIIELKIVLRFFLSWNKDLYHLLLPL